MILQIHQLSKSYQKDAKRIRVLHEVSLNLPAGEFVVVRGSSGCGKSTLLLAAGGLLAPDDGSIRLDGKNLYQMSPNARTKLRATSIGFVFQQFHLVPYLSVLQNVMAAAPSGTGETRRRATALIDRFGLGHRMDHVPSELSTGERQRAALARAMLNRPKLILADEPTGNLDQENADRVLDELKRFAANGGSVLLVTHAAAAALSADRLYELKDGRMKDAGAK